VGLRVRMYRQGLGDCFLLTFDVGGTERHVLIDCGSLGATTTGVRMKQVAENIVATTDGRVELVIATHEHQDHLDGFREQKTAFTTALDVRNVWLAWTENPRDALAQALKKYQADLVAALAAAAAALRASGDDADVDSGRAIEDLLGFVGETRGGGLGFAPTVHEAMEIVRTGLGVAPRYLRPTRRPIEPSFLPGFRFYVLGPPRNRQQLEDLGEHGSSELFHATRGLAAAAGRHATGLSRSQYVARLDAPARAAFERETPFDIRFCVDDREDAKRARAAYAASYFAKDARWRQIGAEWLHTATDLALQLDNLTNNTSLALAIERIADGKVLLFAADAQQGNWLSWHDPARRWTVKASDGSTRDVRAPELLGRAVFYKAGHHGSHNATAKGRGLDLMTRTDELVTFIPVDRAVALGRHPKNSWQMPARALYRALLDRCEGRVVRSDLGWAAPAAEAPDPAVEQELDSLATPAEWASWKASQQAAPRVTVLPTFIDYVLE
jgi:hypothetical protein